MGWHGFNSYDYIQTLGVFKKLPEFQTAVEAAWGKKKSEMIDLA